MPVSNNISVVIICKNAGSTIAKAINTALLVTDDVVVVDSGSTDGTIEQVAKTNARLVQILWNGYGDAKNTGNNIASNDWIFSMDADEYLDDDLIKSLRAVELVDATRLFTIQRLNYLGNKPVHYGAWKNDVVTRLFNKHNAYWDTTAVHEELIVKTTGTTARLKGVLHHYTSPGIATYELKLKNYAALMAEKYFSHGKKATIFKLYLSPVVNFIQNYFIKGGLLDGKEGLQLAIAHARYTFQKYKVLREKRR